MPIRPTSIRRSQSSWLRHDRGGNPLNKPRQTVETNRASSVQLPFSSTHSTHILGFPWCVGSRIAARGGYRQPAQIMVPALFVAGAFLFIRQPAMGEPHEGATVLLDEIDLDQA